MMMFPTRGAICLWVICMCLAVSKCRSEGYATAPNCAKEYECPKYTVVYTQKEFEIRNYTSARWAFNTPPISSTSFTQAAATAYKTLSSYFNGENQEKTKIATTFPVLVQVNGSSYTSFFYLPNTFRQFAPKPIKMGTLEVTSLGWTPKFQWYAAVRRFDGVISDAAIPTEVDALRKSLQSTPYQRAAAEGLGFMVADYNSPGSDLNNRVNEVFIWFT